MCSKEKPKKKKKAFRFLVTLNLVTLNFHQNT